MQSKDHDLSKLPKWAQDRITIAERDRDYYREQTQRMDAGESDTFIPGFKYLGTRDTFLPDGCTVRFHTAEGYVEVGRERNQDGVNVRASRSLAIYPVVSNVIRVTNDIHD